MSGSDTACHHQNRDGIFTAPNCPCTPISLAAHASTSFQPIIVYVMNFCQTDHNGKNVLKQSDGVPLESVLTGRVRGGGGGEGDDTGSRVEVPGVVSGLSIWAGVGLKGDGCNKCPHLPLLLVDW